MSADATATFLERVVAERRADAMRDRSRLPELRARAERRGAPRSFGGALLDARRRGKLAVIAEVKRTSPALGPLAEIRDPAALARAYAEAGAAAISVLTEPRHWGGSLADLEAVRDAVAVPVLCKDVIVDEVQVVAARAAGADAVLLIAEALDDAACARLTRLAADLGMDVLMEAHERGAFARALASDAAVLGVNARDLRSPGTLDRARVAELAPLVAPGRPLVAESGIASAEDARGLPDRVDAVLVGTALVRATVPGDLIAALGAVERHAAVRR